MCHVSFFAYLEGIPQTGLNHFDKSLDNALEKYLDDVSNSLAEGTGNCGHLSCQSSTEVIWYAKVCMPLEVDFNQNNVDFLNKFQIYIPAV